MTVCLSQQDTGMASATLIRSGASRDGKTKSTSFVSDDTLRYLFLDRVVIEGRVIPDQIKYKGQTIARSADISSQIAESLKIQTHFLEFDHQSATATIVRILREETEDSRNRLIPIVFKLHHYLAGDLLERIESRRVDQSYAGFVDEHLIPGYGQKLPKPLMEMELKGYPHATLTQAQAVNYGRISKLMLSEMLDMAATMDSAMQEYIRPTGLIHLDGRKVFGVYNGNIILVGTFGTGDDDRYLDTTLKPIDGDLPRVGRDYLEFYYRKYSSTYYERKNDGRLALKENLPRLPQWVLEAASNSYISLSEKLRGERFDSRTA